MKYLFLITILSFLSTFSNAQDSPFNLVQKNYVPNASYMPFGFDNNDNSEIVFEGFYPNACYKVGLSYHEVDTQKKEIHITDTTYFAENAICARVIIPYVKQINFGPLAIGDYKVFFKNSDDEDILYGNLNVVKAKNDQTDDFLYAPIDQAIFRRAKDGKPAILTLEGKMTNTCMQYDRTEIRYQAGANTIAILPITKMLEQTDCHESDEPESFSKDIELTGYTEGRYLLHIRSLNGKAVNKIVDLK